MSTSYIFEGKKIKIPGVYSTIKSGIKNPPIPLDFGNTLIIDYGIGAAWGGGSGVDGELESAKDAVYTFRDISDYRDFVQGGILWDLGERLFRPSDLGVNGVSSVTLVKAATTVTSKINFTFTGGGVAGGTLEIATLSEGLVGNGAVDANNHLIKGYGAKMRAGIIDTTKFIIDFYRTGFVGDDAVGDPFNFVEAADAPEVLLARSIEFSNIAEMIAWCNTDTTFKANFKLTTSTVTGTGVVDAGDLSNYLSFELAAGGTETYSSANIDLALDAVNDLTFDFVLATDYGTEAESNDNIKLLAWVAEEAKIKPDIYVGGGLDVDTFTSQSISASEFFDSQYVSVVHGGLKKNTRNGVKILPSIYHAAQMLGREAGLSPQVPLTFKNLRIDGVAHPLNDKQVEQGLDAGLLMTRFEGNSFDIIKGINSLQNNDFLINEDGTTSSKQIRRVSRQINKELVFNIKRSLLKQPNGVNRNTLGAEDLKAYVENYLKGVTANSITDNLILGFQNVTVNLVGGSYNVNYEIITNREINFVFLTGFIVE